jgi:hypothetical protein
MRVTHGFVSDVTDFKLAFIIIPVTRKGVGNCRAMMDSSSIAILLDRGIIMKANGWPVFTLGDDNLLFYDKEWTDYSVITTTFFGSSGQ